MNDYLTLKWIHIVSSVLLVGTGFGSAFYLFFANRQPDLKARAVVARLVVRADWWFTTPAVIVQPISGMAMALMAGWPLTTSWLALSLGLYVFAGLCWLPVVWLQIRMHGMLEQAIAEGRPLPAAYATHQRWWEGLGYPGFTAMLVVFWLMVNKPTLWG